MRVPAKLSVFINRQDHHYQTMSNETTFEQFLNRQDEESWSAALATLLRSTHDVDRQAVQIWFAFYPLELWRALNEAEDRETLAQQLLLQGDYELKNQIDSSHHFLYGHRFWPQVKRAVEQSAESDSEQAGSLADRILSVAREVAKQTGKDESLLVGITAVAFMTLQQVGLAALKASPGTIVIDKKHAKRSPEQILRDRAKDDSQGLLGFLRTINKRWTVTWDENDARAKYKLHEAKDLPWGGADDQCSD